MYALVIMVLYSAIYGTSIRAENLIFYNKFQPFSYVENDHIEGLFVDLVTTVFDDMGVKYTLNAYPFKRAMRMGSRGKGVVIGIYKTDERLMVLDYSEPFYQEKTVFFVRKGKSFPFQKVNDLRDKTIAVKLGWSYGAEFDQAKEKKVFATSTGEARQIFRWLKMGRIDAVVDNELSGLSSIKKLGFQRDLETLPTPLLSGDIYIAVKKGTNAKLLERFNRHVKKIKENGVYEIILAKYR